MPNTGCSPTWRQTYGAFKLNESCKWSIEAERCVWAHQWTEMHRTYPLHFQFLLPIILNSIYFRTKVYCVIVWMWIDVIMVAKIRFRNCCSNSTCAFIVVIVVISNCKHNICVCVRLIPFNSYAWERWHAIEPLLAFLSFVCLRPMVGRARRRSTVAIIDGTWNDGTKGKICCVRYLHKQLVFLQRRNNSIDQVQSIRMSYMCSS